MKQSPSGSHHMEPPGFALVRDDHALWPWLKQLFVIAFIPIAFEIFEGSVLGWSEVAGSPFGVIGIQVFNPIAISALALVAGVVVSTRFPAKSAKWIWTLPCAMLLMAIVWDLGTFHNLHLIWVEYFYWDHPGADEGPVLRDFLTYPALSSAAYSAAAAFISRSSVTGRGPTEQPAGR